MTASDLWFCSWKVFWGPLEGSWILTAGSWQLNPCLVSPGLLLCPWVGAPPSPASLALKALVWPSCSSTWPHRESALSRCRAGLAAGAATIQVNTDTRQRRSNEGARPCSQNSPSSHPIPAGGPGGVRGPTPIRCSYTPADSISPCDRLDLRSICFVPVVPEAEVRQHGISSEQTELMAASPGPSGWLRMFDLQTD